MAQPGTRSLDLVAAEVQRERDAQLRHFGALAGLWAFWPRRFGAIDVRALADRYLAAEPRFATLRLLDTQIATVEGLAAILHRKGTRLKLSMLLVAVAALLILGGAVLH